MRQFIQKSTFPAKRAFIILTILTMAVIFGGCAAKQAVKTPKSGIVTAQSCAKASNLIETQSRDVLYQVSTVNALMQGDYNGSKSFAELKNRGDFGLGTFDALDGEMIAMEGKFYQVTSDGKVHSVSDEMTTPFAVVTFFDPDQHFSIDNPMDLHQLRKFLDSKLPTFNVFYAVRVDGHFAYVKTRSVPAQKKPYPPLAEVAKEQSIFEFRDIKGSIVGIRCPQYFKGINVPEWHLHFITEDRSAGGHLLDAVLDTENATLELDLTSGFNLSLPQSEPFYLLNLNGDTTHALKKIEN